MKTSIFCYGTLMFPEIMQAVAGRRSDAVVAALEGYACYLIEGEVFPGLVEEQGACTEGVLYRHLDMAARWRLDRYEGSLYERRQVAVRTARHGLLVTETYVVSSEGRVRLSSEPWNKMRFAARHLTKYLKKLQGTSD